MDPLSDNKIWFMPSFSEKDAEKELLDRMGVEKNFKSPTKFSDISDSQLQSYAGVLIPGGEFTGQLIDVCGILSPHLSYALHQSPWWSDICQVASSVMVLTVQG